MAALISFKVDVDMATGIPTKNLLPECVNYFKSELKLDIKTSDEACASPEVIKCIQAAIERTNARAVSRAAHLRKFKLIPDDFSIPSGELTPTMKLKRKVTEKKYQALIDSMFNEAGAGAKL
jgi:long-chain-fatty-acid--CoA ligase ACSBG